MVLVISGVPLSGCCPAAFEGTGILIFYLLARIIYDFIESQGLIFSNISGKPSQPSIFNRMRRPYFKTIKFTCLFVIGFVHFLTAQTSSFDKVVMLNGEEKTGKVTEVGDDQIKFVHSGESITYSLKKNDINKIQFASGRIEVFTKVATESAASDQGNSLLVHHNKVAILPFNYIGSGGSRDEKMSSKVQQDCYNLLKKSAANFNILDPLTTNALLIKHNITPSHVEGMLPVELTEILGVEYILMGTVTINQTATTTGSGSYSSAKAKNNKISGYTVGGSSTSTQYKTTVDMMVYNDQGADVFNKSHVSFWPNEDSYTITLQYLIKRTPLYSK
jgi:hypothetical protein